ncbi:MAG: chemotaxis protein CheA [Planctomycetota bacterium]
MSSENRDLFESFVTEAIENLADVESDFLAVEANGADIDTECVNKVFRSIHSMKGTAEYLGLHSIGSLTHEMESVLNLIRNRELIPSSGIVEVLLRVSDTLVAMVHSIETSNDVDITEHISALQATVNRNAAPEIKERISRIVDVEIPNGSLAFVGVSEQELVSRQQQGYHIYVVEADLIGDVERRGKSPIDFLKSVYEHGELIDSYVNTAGIGNLEDDLPLRLMLTLLIGTGATGDQVHQRLGVSGDCVHHIASPEEGPWGKTPSVPSATQSGSQGPTASSADPTPPKAATLPTSRQRPDPGIRVKLKALDDLMELAGELVFAQNELQRVVGCRGARELERASRRIGRIAADIQEAIMKTRMQPFGLNFGKLSRIARDLARTLGKKCRFETRGEDVELDKAIIENINDPLTHILRNSMDHGLETPEVRMAAGKPAEGSVVIRAFHQGGQVNITITDDGAGIDADLLRDRAVSRKIITADQARTMSDRDSLQLIFHPGFSTAESINNVSGRGVGMDVVKTNIEGLGGTVDIDTTLGRGTTIHIELPLTLAIVPSMIVSLGARRFAIPQAQVSELIRIRPSELNDRVQRIQDAELLRLRTRLVPLVRLDAMVNASTEGNEPRDPGATEHDRTFHAGTQQKPSPLPRHDFERHPASHTRSASTMYVVVVRAGGHEFGIAVDRVGDSQEILVKPLSPNLNRYTLFAGASVLGDGGVALSLDVAGIAEYAKLGPAPEDQVEPCNGTTVNRPEEIGSSTAYTRHVSRS